MEKNMEVYERVRAVPKEALKVIHGGRLKGMSDINPMWRLKMLTELFGVCGVGWKIEIVDKRLEKGSGDEVVCFVDILLYVKVDGAWSEPIPGMGGSSFVALERNGLYTSDECFKMAYTDAISVACKSLGFAADVYFASDTTKYTTKADALGEQATAIKDRIANKSAPAPVVGEVPDSLKAKYQEFKGNADGLEKWVGDQMAKGKTYPQMEQTLQAGIDKKAQ